MKSSAIEIMVLRQVHQMIASGLGDVLNKATGQENKCFQFSLAVQNLLKETER